MLPNKLAVSLYFLPIISSAPLHQRFAKWFSHEKRQDWSTIKYDLSGVDWSTVSYDLSNVNWNTVFDVPQAQATVAAAVQVAVTTTQPIAAPATTPVAAGNVVTIHSTTTAFVVASTPVAAGNVVTIHSTTTAIVQAAETPVPVASTSSGKRGLGWDPTSPVSSAFEFLNSGVSWYFNWSPTPSGGMPSNWEFYANIWGSGGIQNLANELQGSPKLIGFNEPDSASQANLGVADAVALYYQYLVPLKSSGKISQLGTPAVTNSWNAGQGLNWLSDFVHQCSNCGLDFAVVHWYAESIDDFKNHVTQAHQITGLPINVAEFAYTAWDSSREPSDAEVLAFMTEAISWLDAQSFVSAYAWFGSMYVSEAKYPALGAANSLINADLTSLTELGMAY